MYDLFLVIAGAVVGPSKFSQRQLAVSLIDVNCTGKEAHLTDCDSKTSSLCVGGDDADVVCQGEQKHGYVST